MQPLRAVNSVRTRFSAAAATYDEQGGVQPHVSRRVAELCRGFSPARILDVGCGTGRLTTRLRQLYPKAELTALDLAPGMIEQARRQLGRVAEEVSWCAEDVRDHRPEAPYGMIASSSALHWLDPLDGALVHLAQILEPGGRLVAGLMLEGTLGELHGLRAELFPDKPAPVHLPSGPDVRDACRTCGLRLEVEEVESVQVEYPSAGAFLRVLRAQGVTGGTEEKRTPLTRGELRRLTAEYDGRFRTEGGGVWASYEVLYLRAR